MLLDRARRIALSEFVYPPHFCMRRHSHPTASIGLVLSGSVEEDSGGATDRYEALSVVVKPAGVNHQDRFGERGARMISLTLPRRAGVRLGRYGGFHGGLVARLALDVLRATRDGGAGQARAMLRLLGAVQRTGSASAPEAWILAARADLDQGASVAAAAQRLGVHPGSLTRAYRRAFGLTPLEDRARGRIRRAAELLASSTTKLVSVAALTGFSDQAHLTRVFKRQTGTTPAMFRSLVNP